MHTPRVAAALPRPLLSVRFSLGPPWFARCARQIWQTTHRYQAHEKPSGVVDPNVEWLSAIHIVTARYQQVHLSPHFNEGVCLPLIKSFIVRPHFSAFAV